MPVVATTCAGLVTVIGTNGVPRAELATRLPRVSRDGRTYVFAVRPGSRFSDGRPLTAANFAAAIRRVRNPFMQSPHARSYAADVVSASARRSTLTIRLRRRAGDFLARLAMPWACPVPVGLPADPLGIDPAAGLRSVLVASRTPVARSSSLAIRTTEDRVPGGPTGSS